MGWKVGGKSHGVAGGHESQGVGKWMLSHGQEVGRKQASHRSGRQVGAESQCGWVLSHEGVKWVGGESQACG